MTERIYYTDPECRTFEASVTRSFTHDGRPSVLLDRTAFYPTSGGQPHDIGALTDTSSNTTVDVIDTVDLGDDIAHVLSQPLAAGAAVHAVIHWERRFDHMQQHTGQHVLSAAFERTSGNATVSFHMGAETSTIDLAREATPAEAAGAEDAANQIIWDDRAIRIRFVSESEAAALPLRKEPARGGTLRLIEVDDVDLSACGGTHVGRTGGIGMIAILGLERFKGTTRVSFVCGQRALRSMRTLRDAVAGSVRVLSVLPAELPGAIERLQADAKAQSKDAKELRGKLAAHEAAAFLEGATSISGVRVVVRTLSGWDAGSLKIMAASAVERGSAIAALLVPGPPLQIVIARSADVTVDANALLRELVGRYGGKGGGRPELAQGGGLAGDIRQIEWTLSGLIEDALSA